MVVQRECVCGFEGQNAMGLVHFAEHVKILSSDVQNTPQPCRQSTKLRNMTISIKTKVVVKCGSSEIVCMWI